MEHSHKTLAIDSGQYLAYNVLEGNGPTVLFLSGYRSDMFGTKAMALEAHCQKRRQAYVRFDYRGHGLSSGEFESLTIADWFADALAISDRVIDGPIVVVGSSMGGWVMSLLARARPERIVGMVGISCAPDLTERVLEPSLTPSERRQLASDGVIYRPSEYDDQPYPVTQALLQQGLTHRVLDSQFKVHGPVRLLHGTADVDVPWTLSTELAECMAGDDVATILIRGADHRLSSDADLLRLMRVLDEVLRDSRAGVGLDQRTGNS